MSIQASAALVSGALEEELRQKVRARGLVVWLDTEGAFTRYVDQRVETVDGPRVLAFRGSFLELMLALEPLTGGVERPRLIVHLPGLSQADVAASPLLELWRAGVSYDRRLDTLITTAATGRATTDTIEAFLATRPTLEAADAWLGKVAAEGSTGIKNQLIALTPSGFIDELVRRGPLSERVVDPVDRAAMFEQVEAWLGLSAAWRDATFDERAPRVDALLYAIASFAMAVEYVFDLKRAPYSASLKPLTTTAPALRDACRALCGHLRSGHADLYQRIADQTEIDLPEEIEHAVATDLGKVDTFRFEEDKVLAYALDALDNSAYDEAEALALSRAEPPDASSSIWTKRPDRRAAWLVVRDAARLGTAIDRAPAKLADVGGLDLLIQAYVAHGAAVDRAHRQLEQRRISALFPEIPHFERLRRCADGMRVAWLDWADQWARHMASVCKSHGILPPARMLQRTIFDDVVMPLVREARATPRKGVAEVPTALFVVDALRFEMAEELFREMAAVPHTTATLEARAAELPTITCVGMNAIAPTTVSEGVLPLLRPILDEGPTRIGISGFATGAFKVDTRANRWRAMFDRAGGDCIELSLDQAVSLESGQLKNRVSRSRLVVVHSLELDDAGESGVGPMVFDQVLQKLRAAWRLLREADVRRFVVTSDHGFLILDGIRRAPEVQGRKTDPERRHVLTRNAAVEPGRLRVPLGELGYLGGEGVFLVLSETTNVFDRGARQTSFVHGGNSLQERVVPVISVVHRSATGASTGRYRVIAERGEGVAGMHRLMAEVQLVQLNQMSLAFVQAKDVDITLRVASGDGQIEIVQASSSAAVVASSTLRVVVGKRFEVFFRISGASHERVQVEVAHPGGALEVEPAVISDWFEAAVHASLPRKVQSDIAGPAAAPSIAVTTWLDAVTPGYRPIYERLATHGVIEEAEVVSLLGGHRLARRFGNDVDKDRPKLPFALRVEQGEGGKRWVREGGGG